MDDRVKFKTRRDGPDLWIDLWFDDCQLGSRLVVGGDENTAKMVESGELRLTRDSKLVFEDGEQWYPIPQRRKPKT